MMEMGGERGNGREMGVGWGESMERKMDRDRQSEESVFLLLMQVENSTSKKMALKAVSLPCS